MLKNVSHLIFYLLLTKRSTQPKTSPFRCFSFAKSEAFKTTSASRRIVKRSELRFREWLDTCRINKWSQPLIINRDCMRASLKRVLSYRWRLCMDKCHDSPLPDVFQGNWNHFWTEMLQKLFHPFLSSLAWPAFTTESHVEHFTRGGTKTQEKPLWFLQQLPHFKCFLRNRKKIYIIPYRCLEVGKQYKNSSLTVPYWSSRVGEPHKAEQQERR